MHFDSSSEESLTKHSENAWHPDRRLGYRAGGGAAQERLCWGSGGGTGAAPLSMLWVRVCHGSRAAWIKHIIFLHPCFNIQHVPLGIDEGLFFLIQGLLRKHTAWFITGKLIKLVFEQKTDYCEHITVPALLWFAVTALLGWLLWGSFAQFWLFNLIATLKISLDVPQRPLNRRN